MSLPSPLNKPDMEQKNGQAGLSIKSEETIFRDEVASPLLQSGSVPLEGKTGETV